MTSYNRTPLEWRRTSHGVHFHRNHFKLQVIKQSRTDRINIYRSYFLLHEREIRIKRQTRDYSIRKYHTGQALFYNTYIRGTNE